MRVLLIPNRKERILELLFDDSERTYGRGNYDYDGHVDGANIFVAFDGDIARLIRFRNALDRTDSPNEVVCFSHQAKFLREYLGKDVVIKTLSLDVLEKEFGIGESENEKTREETYRIIEKSARNNGECQCCGLVLCTVFHINITFRNLEFGIIMSIFLVNLLKKRRIYAIIYYRWALPSQVNRMEKSMRFLYYRYNSIGRLLCIHFGKSKS